MSQGFASDSPRFQPFTAGNAGSLNPLNVPAKAVSAEISVGERTITVHRVDGVVAAYIGENYDATIQSAEFREGDGPIPQRTRNEFEALGWRFFSPAVFQSVSAEQYPPRPVFESSGMFVIDKGVLQAQLHRTATETQSDTELLQKFGLTVSGVAGPDPVYTATLGPWESAILTCVELRRNERIAYAKPQFTEARLLRPSASAISRSSRSRPPALE